MQKPLHALRPAALAAALSVAAVAHAAGGHFDVDDASVLEPEHCQYEVWFTRAPAGSAGALHLGPACRTGPVELGLNVDRWRERGVTRLKFGPQLKWVVDPWFDKVSAGLVWAAAFDQPRRSRPSHTVYVPVTVTLADKLVVHANLGADKDDTGARTRRVGLAGEWVANDKLTLILERVKFSGDWTSRLGGRVSFSDSISLDVSAARTGQFAAKSYTIGLNHDFAR